MKKYFLYLMALGLAFSVACSKEDGPLQPREEMEETYVLPQGNNAFDTRIVNFHKRTGVFILYKFSPRDAYWEKFSWREAFFNEAGATTTGAMTIESAKPEYIEKQLEFLEKNYLNFFSDEYLTKILPIRILLCSTLQNYVENKPYPMTYYFGIDNLCIGYGDERIDEITPNEIKTFRNGIIKKTLDNGLKLGLIEIPQEFKDLGTYGQAVTRFEMHEKGFVEYSSAASYITPEWDWKAYVKAIIQNPYTLFITPPVIPEKYPYLQGILTPEKDVNGLIRKKYDIVIKYFFEKYNMDLQAIGNYAE